MKRTLVVAAGLAVLSTPSVFASKARMAGLLQNNNAEGTGSFYIADQRNTFYNPAHYNTFNNFAIVEWGTDTDSTELAGANRQVSGGFARQAGNFVYSVYLGDDNGSQRETDIGAVGASDHFLEENNRLELSFAGDAGVKWGATLWYSDTEDNLSDAAAADDLKTVDSSTMGLRLGGIMGDWSASLELDFKDEANGACSADGCIGGTATVTTTTGADDSADKYEGDTGLVLTVGKAHGDWNFFAEYQKNGYEITDDEAADADQVGTSENSSWLIGAGHTKKLDDKATLFMDVTYANSKTETNKIAEDFALEQKTSGLEATVAMEAKANSWLTWRAAVSQEVLINSDDTQVNNAGADGGRTHENKGRGTTGFAVGMSFTYGKLMLDGVVQAANTNDGQFALDELLSDVSLHYWF